MIIATDKPKNINSIENKTIAFNQDIIYTGPIFILREATEEEYIQATIKEFGKAPVRRTTKKCYYYEVSID